MLTHQEAMWLQIITILSVSISPVIAVILTIWYQNRHVKRRAELDLFLTLISTRSIIPIDYNYILALNRIDVVFHGNQDILQLWHEYYDLLMQPQVNDVPLRRDHKRVELLSAIGKHLGYKKLSQIDLEKYYQPVGHYDNFVMNQDILKELLRVLKSTETLYLINNKIEPPQNRIIEPPVS